jgi:hypothetical protein
MKIIKANFYKNKDFIKYLVLCITLIILVSFLFLDKFGSLIPNIMEYFKPENVENLNVAGQYKGKNLNVADQYVVNLGYFGSFLAGTLGLVFGFLSLIFLVFTFLNQSRKNEISDIENRIFKLIELLVEIKNQNNLSKISQDFLEKNKNLSNLETLKNNLKEQHVDFSNFFRMLYQILKYINEHEHIIHNRYFDKNLDPQVKSYTNIIRSYLDTNLLTCLAINCYCLEQENGEYNNYKKLLERYQLLEHLPNILPLQFSSYLYYDSNAIGNSTWFKDFSVVRDELIEISHSDKTRNFCEVFLLFLAKKHGYWSDKNIRLRVIKNQDDIDYFHLSIWGIDNPQIPNELKFRISKDISLKNLSLTNYPFNASSSDFKPNICMENNKLKLSYLKPNSSYSIGYEVNITLSILSTDKLEIDLNKTSNSFCILPF